MIYTASQDKTANLIANTGKLLTVPNIIGTKTELEDAG